MLVFKKLLVRRVGEGWREERIIEIEVRINCPQSRRSREEINNKPGSLTPATRAHYSSAKNVMDCH